MSNKPTMYGLQQAVNIAQDLYNKARDTRESDLSGFIAAKESLRKAKENLRLFTYKQKSHFTAKGTVIRA